MKRKIFELIIILILFSKVADCQNTSVYYNIELSGCQMNYYGVWYGFQCQYDSQNPTTGTLTILPYNNPAIVYTSGFSLIYTGAYTWNWDSNENIYYNCQTTQLPSISVGVCDLSLPITLKKEIPYYSSVSGIYSDRCVCLDGCTEGPCPNPDHALIEPLDKGPVLIANFYSKLHPTSKITDLSQVVPEGGNLRLQLAPLDDNFPGQYYEDYNVQVKPFDAQESDWLSLGEFPFQKGDNLISISSLSSKPEWLGIPLSVRLYDNGNMKYESNRKTFIVLPKLHISNTQIDPLKCHGYNNAQITFTIDNVIIPSATQLQGQVLNYLVYADRCTPMLPGGCGISTIEYPQGSGKYYCKSIPVSVNQDVLSGKIIINNSTLKTADYMGAGLYEFMISAPFESNKFPVDTFIYISEPDQFIANLDYTHKDWGDNHMGYCQSTGSLSYSVTQNGTPAFFVKCTNKSDIPLGNNTSGSFDLSYDTYNTQVIRLVDAKNCAAALTANLDTTFTVNFNKPTNPIFLTIDQSKVIDVKCTGGSTGEIPFTVGGDISVSSYTVSNISSPDISGSKIQSLPAGTYTITATDASGCSDTKSGIVIEQPTSLPSVSTVNTLAPTCYGYNNGKITSVVAAGGSGSGYQYSLTGTNSWKAINAETSGFLASASGTLYVKDGNECVTSTNYLIPAGPSSPVSITVPTGGIKNVTCSDAYNGSVTINISGGTAANGYHVPTGFNRTPNTNTYTKTGLGYGPLSIHVYDDNSCSLDVSESVDLSEFVIKDTATTPALCSTKNDGSISYGIENGNANNSFSLYKKVGTTYSELIETKTDITTPAPFTGLLPGIYKIEASNDDCTASIQDIRVSASNPLVLNQPGHTGATGCGNSATGTITVTPQSGASGLTDIMYKLSSGGESSSGFFDQLVPGGYSVYATYSGDVCVTPDISVTVDSLNNRPHFNVTQIDSATCSLYPNGAITFGLARQNVKKEPYGYFKVVNNIETSISTNFSAQLPGFYFIRLRDAANIGCFKDTVIEVPISKKKVILSEPVPAKTSCNGASNGQISVDALSTGGYTDILYYLYKKNIVTPIDFNASGDFSGLSQGNYEVKAKYATYCFSAAKDVEILPNSSPVSVSISKLTDQSCTSVVNGSFTATASSQGAQTYTITDIQLDNVSISPFANPAPFSGKSAGTYVIKAIDNNNCFAEESVVIENLGNNPHFTVASFDSTACSSATNGAIHFTTTQPDPKTPYIYKRITGAIETPITIEDNAYNNLSNSTYTISITDAEGCSSKSDVQVPVSKRVISLKQPILTDSATCSGAPTGKIHVSNVPNTGFGSISYIVKQSGNTIGTNSTGNFSGLTDGLYYVKAFDGFNCATSDQWVLVDTSKLRSVHMNAVKIADQSCAAVNNGRIQISATSTYGGDSYNISKIKIYRNNVKKDSTITASDTLFGGLNTGNYKIIVTDQHNCTNQQLVTIANLNNIPHPNIASFDSTDCVVASNGVINFKTAQLIPRLPYTWFKAPNENPENLLETGNNGIYHYSGVKSGTTNIRIKDNEGCYRDTVVEVPVTKQLLNINLSKVINASCPGSSNGKAFYQRANGVPFKKGYCFEVRNTTTLDKEDSVFSPNIAVILGGYKKGTYQVVVTDSLNCSANNAFTLTEPSPVKIDSLIHRVKAKNGSDGGIETFITGGNSKYEYQWFKILNNSPVSLMPISDTTELHTANDSAIVSLANMKAGKYRILLRDTANCIFEGTTDWITRNFIIPEPTFELGLNITNNKSVSCFGLQDGSLQFSGTGGWNNYQYSSSLNPSVWSASQEIKNLPKGTYELLVKDDEGIVFSKQVGVNQPDLLSVQKVETKDALCFGSKDGKASLMVTGGNYPYWVSTNSDGSNAIKDTIIATLGGGTHTIYVRDSLYCGTSAIVFIGQPSSRVSLADTIITESRCGQNYGAIQVLPQGGNPGTGYEYFWKYSNVITKKDSVFVANNTASNLYSGLYKLSIKDSHACIDTFDLFVPDITDLNIDSVVTQKALCQTDLNGTASVFISKGNPSYTITWPDGSNNATVQGMKAGNNYYVYVTDQKKCKVQKKFVIGHQNNIPYPNVAAFDSAACIVAGNGAIHFNITEHLDKQPYNYYLLNNAVESPVIGSGQNFVYSGLFSKGYNIRVKNKENCYNDTVIAVPMTKLPVQLMLDSITASSCIQSKNGKLYLSGRNGVKEDGGIYHYQLWSGETQNGISAIFAGLDPQKLHSVHVYDKYNCPDSISNITIPVELNHLTLTYPEIKDVSCYGYSDGKATISLHNGIRSYRYDVYNTLFTNKVDSLLSSNSIADFKGLRNGNYRIDVKDSVNCLSSGLFTIGSPLPFSMANRNIIPLCTGVNNGEISVDMNGGTPAYSYSWSNGKAGNTIKKLQAGNYSLTVTDSHNCTQNYSLNLTYEKTIKPNLGPNITLCSGNGHTLRVGNFADYQWHSNQGFTSSDSVIKVTTPDLYSVMVTDADGCIGSDTIQVYMSATPMNAEFLMASQIMQNDTLMVIESSWPSADSVIWDLPARSRVIARGDYYEQVIMPDTGLYNITLKAFRNDCFDLITKQVEVVPRSATNSHVKSAIAEMIKKYVVYPNPSSGNFSVEVKLREPAEGTLKLVSLAQGRVIHIKQIKGSDSYLESYSLPSLPSGIYALYLQVGKESKTITIIKQ